MSFTDFVQPEQKPELLGHVILQSCPVTQREAQMWLTMMRTCFPEEVFTDVQWIPIDTRASN